MALETYLPELGSDLVTALAGLNMNDFSHGVLAVVVYSIELRVRLSDDYRRVVSRTIRLRVVSATTVDADFVVGEQCLC